MHKSIEGFTTNNMGKRVAIMQPYFFPYLGFYQLITLVDSFILYDDVNFMKQKWINRNKIIVNGLPYTFTLPLSNISQNKLILDTNIHEDIFNYWREKFLKTLFFNFKFNIRIISRVKIPTSNRNAFFDFDYWIRRPKD